MSLDPTDRQGMSDTTAEADWPPELRACGYRWVMDADAVDALAQRYARLTDTVRDLIDLSIRTAADGSLLERAETLLAEARDVLSAHVDEEPGGVSLSGGGRHWVWSNAAIGLRNPSAIPLTHQSDTDEWCRSEVELGLQHEGQPGQVHGGVAALLLDQVMGRAACLDGTVAVTGTLTISYLRPLPLGRVSATALRHDAGPGRRLAVSGKLTSGGETCVEAEGIFVIPSWARRQTMPGQRRPVAAAPHPTAGAEEHA